MPNIRGKSPKMALHPRWQTTSVRCGSPNNQIEGRCGQRFQYLWRRGRYAMDAAAYSIKSVILYDSRLPAFMAAPLQRRVPRRKVSNPRSWARSRESRESSPDLGNRAAALLGLQTANSSEPSTIEWKNLAVYTHRLRADAAYWRPSPSALFKRGSECRCLPRQPRRYLKPSGKIPPGYRSGLIFFHAAGYCCLGSIAACSKAAFAASLTWRKPAALSSPSNRLAGIGVFAAEQNRRQPMSSVKRRSPPPQQDIFMLRK